MMSTLVNLRFIQINKDEIIDTNGVGDDLVFYVNSFKVSKSLEESIEAGHWLSRINLKQIGPTFPKEKIPFVPKK